MSTVQALSGVLVPMTEWDLGEIVAAEREIYEFPWTVGNFRDAIAAGYLGLVVRAAQGGRLWGYAVLMFGPEEAHLLNLSIVPAVQGQGQGRQFLEALVVRARALGALRLLLEVRPSNGAARRLYERAGFVQIGLRRGYYPAAGARREDALVLELKL